MSKGTNRTNEQTVDMSSRVFRVRRKRKKKDCFKDHFKWPWDLFVCGRKAKLHRKSCLTHARVDKAQETQDFHDHLYLHAIAFTHTYVKAHTVLCGMYLHHQSRSPLPTLAPPWYPLCKGAHRLALSDTVQQQNTEALDHNLHAERADGN